MKTKNRYIVDSSNRLVIKRRREELLADGRFAVDSNNQLMYWLNEPAAWRRLYDLPEKISFKGDWRLNPNYDLELNLNETNDQCKGDCLVIKGEIISTDQDVLVFEVKNLDRYGLLHVRLLKLSGFWQADDFNRIAFVVRKKTSPDIVTLEGVWQVNKNQQIIYTYEKTDLKTKTKSISTLNFEGFWQINSCERLSYILSHSSNSRFDFRVQIESPNLYPKEGAIKYRLGIGLRAKRLFQERIISLYGTWKFSKKLGLSFIIDYGQGKVQSIEFCTDIYLTRKDEVVFSLSNKRKEPLGIRITFTHRFLKKYAAEVFLRIKKSQKEAGIETGLRIPF